MTSRLKLTCATGFLCLALMVVLIGGCNRAGVRIPGASLAFPDTATRYVAKTSSPYSVVVAAPVDHREQHYGERVAGTRWKGCSTDPFWGTDAAKLIQQRLVAELQSSGLFRKVSIEPTGPDDLVVRTEIHAFCSQAAGFLIVRVAGISALRVTVERQGKVLLDQKFEKVVTDADKEYSGSQVATLEQAMTVTMADSLRELMKDMLKRLETEATTWKQSAANR